MNGTPPRREPQRLISTMMNVGSSYGPCVARRPARMAGIAVSHALAGQVPATMSLFPYSVTQWCPACDGFPVGLAQRQWHALALFCSILEVSLQNRTGVQGGGWVHWAAICDIPGASEGPQCSEVTTRAQGPAPQPATYMPLRQ